jgi:ectoine hydroxylase-related dioxygenase (phytanoyl-CoA dioxygenase family)
MKTFPAWDISPQQVKDFERDGVVYLPSLFDDTWVDLLRAGVDRNLAHPGPNGHDIRREDAARRFFEDAFVWPSIPEYRTFLFDSHAAEVAGELMQSEKVSLFFDNVFVKDVGSHAPTPWHQDLPAVSMAGRMLSLWIALDPIPKSDSLELVRGSHRWGEGYIPIRFSNLEEKTGFDDKSLLPSPDFDACRDSLDIVSWDMRAGDAIVFDGMTLHGSGENTTDTRRRAYSVRFGGDGAVYLPKGPASFPKFRDRAVRPGDALGSDTFPLLWKRVKV